MINLTPSDKKFLSGLAKDAKMKRIREDAASLLERDKRNKKRQRR